MSFASTPPLPRPAVRTTPVVTPLETKRVCDFVATHDRRARPSPFGVERLGEPGE